MTSRRSTRCATRSSRTLPRAARARDRARRLPARQHVLHPTTPGRSSPCSTGRWHPRRPAHRPRHLARVLERGGRRRRAHRGAHRRTGDRARRGSRRAPRCSSGTRRRPASTSRTLTWYQSFAFFKLAVVCQGIVARAPAARWSATASMMRSGSSHRCWPAPRRARLSASAHGQPAVHAQDVPGHELEPAPSRNRTASSKPPPARPPRPSGVRSSRKSGKASGSSPSSAVISEAKNPGATALTRMPWRPHCDASCARAR